MHSRKRVRLTDVARKAGVSAMAVSHVINGTGKGVVRVSAKQAEKIRRIARSMDYSANQSARALRGNTLETVGVLWKGSMHPVYERALACLRTRAAKDARQVMAIAVDPPLTWAGSLRALLSHGVRAAVVFCESTEDAVIAAELGREAGVPVIPVRLDGGALPEGGIRSDITQGARLAFARLAASSRALRIVHRPGETAWRDLVARADEFAFSVTEAAGDSPSVQVAPGEALLCSDDRLAAEIMRANAPLRAGTDYALVGWGNAPACEFPEPKLSSVGLNLVAVADAAYRRIEATAYPETDDIPPLLLVRGTVLPNPKSP